MFSRNVTAQSHLDLKVWSCHTLRNELLGTASVNLSNVLKNNGGKSTYDEGGELTAFICWGGEKVLEAWISLNLADQPGDVVSSRTRGCSDCVPWMPSIREVLGRLGTSLCLH